MSALTNMEVAHTYREQLEAGCDVRIVSLLRNGYYM
jgi:hypothetical protein